MKQYDGVIERKKDLISADGDGDDLRRGTTSGETQEHVFQYYRGLF